MAYFDVVREILKDSSVEEETVDLDDHNEDNNIHRNNNWEARCQ